MSDLQSFSKCLQMSANVWSKSLDPLCSKWLEVEYSTMSSLDPGFVELVIYIRHKYDPKKKNNYEPFSFHLFFFLYFEVKIAIFVTFES